MDTVTDMRRSERIRELARMSNARLAAILRGRTEGAHPLTTWSKTELIHAVLRHEFGEAS
jgi:hypothetical protein